MDKGFNRSQADILLARQPILKEDHSIYGFEVLYRGQRFDLNIPDEGMAATGELLNNIYTCVVDEELTAGQPLFINVDQGFIESPSFFPSHSDNIVLEILETVPATADIISKIKELRRLGFEFALDDFIFEQERMAFLPFVSIVKVDVMGCSWSEIEEKLPLLLQHDITLLAEKVEDELMYERCKEVGFSLFQGYHLERPKLVHGVKITASKQVTLRLLTELSRPDISVTEVAELIVCDPRLAMKIMLLVNSSLFSFVRQVNDIKEAVVMLGIEAVKRWAIILLLVTESETPAEIFRTLLARAKALELFATNAQLSNQSDYFILGLFSGLDAILGVDIETVALSLSLKEEMKDALTGDIEGMGAVLHLIKTIERYEQNIENSVINDFIALNKTYWQGLVWADELMEKVVKA